MHTYSLVYNNKNKSVRKEILELEDFICHLKQSGDCNGIKDYLDKQ